MKKVASALILAFSMLASPGFSEQAFRCAQCGMKVDFESRFASRIVEDGKTLAFCDIGDLFVYVNEKNPPKEQSEVRDYESGEWMDAGSAFYVHSEKKFKSPMGWSMAAFRGRNRADGYGTAMDFESARKAVK